ncbi:MAG: hypothetical protein IT327_16000 [Anaerolineae bacterium]|nr:hypothetical protein [Anaerolineae bacterium]
MQTDNNIHTIGNDQYRIDFLRCEAVAVAPGAQTIVYQGWAAEQVSLLIADVQREDQPTV